MKMASAVESVLIEQEAKLAAYQEENSVLGAAVETLQEKLKAAEGRAAAATKRAAEAEAKLHARAAADSGGAQLLAAAQQEVERLRHRLANEHVLAEQVREGGCEVCYWLPSWCAGGVPGALLLTVGCPDAPDS